MSGSPDRRLHTLRSGDGAGLPAGEPQGMWPDLGDLEPYWESFVSFAMSELGGDIRTEFVQRHDGTWKFKATTDLGRKPTEMRSGQTYTQTLVYVSQDDELTFRDARDGSSWVMEDVFGDQTGATSAL